MFFTIFLRPVVLARELTKLHEEIFRGTLAEAVARYGGAAGGSGRGSSADGRGGDSASTHGGGNGGGGSGGGVKDPRGEFTVVLGPLAGVGAGEGGGVEGAARAMAALEARWVM